MEGQAKDGKHESIWEILPSMEILLQYLEASKGKYKYSDYKHITMSINNAWAKLNNYYQCTETSSIYVTTVILNLQLK